MGISRVENISLGIDDNLPDLLKLLITIAKIPSPTGRENRKIEFLRKTVKGYGITDVSIDSVGNCVIKIPGKTKTGAKTILAVSHADTACDPGKEVPLSEDEKYIYGHGVCDNSSGVTALLTTLSLIRNHKLVFPNTLIVAFTVGEEGLGGKGGMRHIIEKMGNRIDAVVNVESHNIGRVTNQVVGQYRVKVSVTTTDGGHSFRDFGKPNTNVILSGIVSDFSRYKFPQTKGRTTFNIAELAGEGNVNVIPKNSSCLVEIRSEHNKHLKKTRQKFESILKSYRKKYPAIKITSQVLSDVEAVVFPKSHKIYNIVTDVQKKLGIVPVFNAGNSDGDIPLGKGIPTATIGVSRGWKTHSLEEYVEKNSLSLGARQAFLVICSLLYRY